MTYLSITRLFAVAGAAFCLHSSVLGQVHQTWPVSTGSIDAVGDVNGDGRDDIIVGVLGFGATVYSGGDGSVLWVLPVPPGTQTINFGEVVSGAGDANGDGTPDFIVAGSGLYGTYSPSLVVVYSGLDASTLHAYTGPGLAGFGSSVAAAGDVDGDGHGDFAVGSDFLDQIVVVLSGATGERLRQFSDGGRFIENAGDVDADGVDDLILSRGDVWVRSGADGHVLYTYSVPWLYTTGAGIGDVDLDGFADFSITRPDGITLYSGRTGALLDTIDDVARVAGVGDQNEDGVPDLVLYQNSDPRLVSGATGEVLARYEDNLIDCALVRDANGDARIDFAYSQWGMTDRRVVLESLSRFSYCGPSEPNSTGRRAKIEATGDVSLAANEFGLRATNLVPRRTAAFIVSRQAGFAPGFGGGDGNLCVSSAFGVLRMQATPAGPDGVLAIDVALPNLPLLGVLLPGDSVYFQCLYRDVGGRTNLSDGVKVYFN